VHLLSGRLADAKPPDTTITVGPSGTVPPPNALVEFTSTEAGSSFTCRLDGGAFTPCTSPRLLTALGAGSHTFEVRAMDAVGNTDPSPARRTFTVAGTPPPPPPPVGPPPPPVGPPPPPVAPRDTVAPVLSRVSRTNARFRVGRGATPISAASPTGTTFRQALSERATVTIRIDQLVAGRRRGSRCIAGRRTGRRCTITRLAGTLRRSLPRGASSVRFSGRIGTRALRVGSYQATLQARDGAGNRSRTARLTFSVVRR
jgi:hypothetical protein